ncbi:MAG TPA: PadR family transcriptional regulator [Alphaproteobacteria bacterium]|nr:PadR family transcriptional regulator [Alphaproteobacteria bacterium]
MTHPYDERWERGWRKFEQAARRFGRQGWFGPRGWEGFGESVRIGRMLASGDLRLVALYLIEQQPRHGYDLIKAIEEKSQGFYSPSPGVVYPALTFLEEAGYVTAAAEGNKKLYTITDEGRAHLDDNREAIQSTLDFLAKAGDRMNRWRESLREGWSSFSPEDREHARHMHEPGPRHRHGPGPDRDMRGVIPELNDARRALKAALAEARAFAPDDQRRVAEILRRTAEEIVGIGHRPEDDIDL